MQHFRSLARAWAADLPLRPLLDADGAAVTAVGLHCLRHGDGERRAEDGVRVTQTDSAVSEVSLDEAEKKYKQMMESNVQLQNEIYKLVLDVDLLQASVQQKDEDLLQTNRKCSSLMAKWEQYQDVYSRMKKNYDEVEESLKRHNDFLRDLLLERYEHNVLQIKYQELAENLANHGKTLKEVQDAQAEAERKCDLVKESNAQLQKENSDLMPDMNILQDHVHELEQKLRKIQCRNDKLTKVGQRAEEDYRILQSQYAETLKQRDELLKEEKYELMMSQVNTLQDSVQHLEKELREKRGKCEEITKEREREQEGHSLLKRQQEQMTETFKLCDELLKKHHRTQKFQGASGSTHARVSEPTESH